MSGRTRDRSELSEFQQEVLKSAEARLDHELERRGMTRRQLMKGGMALAASVGLGALFAACGGDDAEVAPEEAPPAPEPAPAPASAPAPEPAPEPPPKAEARTTLVQLEATIAPALDSDGAGGGVGRSFQQTYANVSTAAPRTLPGHSSRTLPRRSTCDSQSRSSPRATSSGT